MNSLKIKHLKRLIYNWEIPEMKRIIALNEPEQIECVREIENNYIICKRYKKPAVWFSLGKEIQ